jgi:hypothetical protein
MRMMHCRVLLVLLLCGPSLRAAELRTLKGEVVSGELVAASAKEIVLQKDGKRVATPVQHILQVDFGNQGKVPSDAKFIDVELTDGTLLHCAQLTLKEKQVDLTLLAGQQVKVPLAGVANILNEAHIDKNRREWTERLAKKRRRDVLAIVKEGVVNPLEGTLGAGDAEGKTIEFTLATGRKVNVPLTNVHGLIFERALDPNAPPAICKVLDAHKNVLYASGLAATPTVLTVTTPAGATIEFTPALLSRLDFSRDKLAFLSDLEPSRVVETSTEERIEHYRRDKNLDDGPIRLGGITFAKGLAIHATTELEFDLKGEYREFKAVAGIDDVVGGIDGPTLLKIEGDGKELFSLTVTRKDKRRDHPVTLNIKDVQKLKIVVASGDLLDLGKHLTLADAKVSK